MLGSGGVVNGVENDFARRITRERRIYLDANRTEFTGPDAVWYWDVAGTWNINDAVQLRLGVNNVFDKDAETYAPNVQSGTDPSTYDVVGRRVFGSLRLRF